MLFKSHTKKLASVISLWMCALAAVAAPSYHLKTLLRRAEHIFVVDLVSHTDTNATFEVREVLRGDKNLKTLVLSHKLSESQLPEDTKGLLIFSQGDDWFGPPKAEFLIRQPTYGQGGYRGWILGEIEVKNPSERQKLIELVGQSPYQGNIYKKTSKSSQK